MEVEPGALNHYCRSLRLDDAAAALEGLARAIAATRGWPAGCEGLLVVRRGPRPWLGLLGRFDPGGEAWLAAQIRTLSGACAELRYVDWPRVQQDCERLADRLASSLGQELSHARFVAIPRGGLVVLALLAARLGLSKEQMSGAGSTDSPLVVVDDCAVSGVQLARFLSEREDPVIVVAHLYSHPELRVTVLAREPRVRACLTVNDLRGRRLDPAGLPQDTGDPYWLGLPETLCFPWNEPDRSFWNPVRERWEASWRIVPPELCLKNRPAPGTKSIPVQVQPEAGGPLRPTDRTISAELDGQAVLCDLESRRCFALRGAASDLWRAVVRHGDLEAAVTRLLAEYDVPAEDLRGDAWRFVEELLSRGLLECREAAPPAG